MENLENMFKGTPYFINESGNEFYLLDALQKLLKKDNPFQSNSKDGLSWAFPFRIEKEGKVLGFILMDSRNNQIILEFTDISEATFETRCTAYKVMLSYDHKDLKNWSAQLQEETGLFT